MNSNSYTVKDLWAASDIDAVVAALTAAGRVRKCRPQGIGQLGQQMAERAFVRHA